MTILRLRQVYEERPRYGCNFNCYIYGVTGGGYLIGVGARGLDGAAKKSGWRFQILDLSLYICFSFRKGIIIINKK